MISPPLTFPGPCPTIAPCPGSARRHSPTASRRSCPARKRTSRTSPTRWPTSSIPAAAPAPSASTLEFDAFEGPDHDRAAALARRSPQYAETADDGGRRHHAAFETQGARALRDLYEIVGRRPGTEVLVDGKRMPYATELWLPLFWLFVGSEETA